MRVSFIIIALLSIASVSAAPHVTITYSIDQSGEIQVVSLEGSERPFSSPESGYELVRWMAYSDGIRTASVDDRFSFDIILDTFDEHGGYEETHDSLIRVVHVPIRETTDRIVAFIDERRASVIDFSQAMCSDACPSCRALFDDPCADTEAQEMIEASHVTDPAFDPFWIIVTILAIMVIGAYAFLLVKMRNR